MVLQGPHSHWHARLLISHPGKGTGGPFCLHCYSKCCQVLV